METNTTKERKKLWFLNNKDRISEQRKIWRANNKDRIREYARKWHEKHPGYSKIAYARSVNKTLEEVRKCIPGGLSRKERMENDPKYKEYIRELIKRIKNNPETRKKYYEKSRKTVASQRRRCLEYYSQSTTPFCKCCGESIYEFLTLDHIYGGGDNHRDRPKHYGLKSGRGSGYWRDILKEKLPIFQVLCFNCNCAKGTKPTCPYQGKHSKI